MFNRVLLALVPLLLGPPVAGARPLAVNPIDSSVTFKVKATLHSFTGTTEGWKADVDLDEKSGLPQALVFSLEIEGMKTGNTTRDREMLEWLEEEKFPAITFELTGFSPRPEGYLALGDLTLHGQTRPVSFPVTIRTEGDRVTFQGEVVIDHREYGLGQVRKFGLLTVSPIVNVAFSITGKSS